MPDPIKYYMNYTIFFQDESEYQFAIGLTGGVPLEMTPREAASIFGIPHPYPSGDISAIPRGIYFFAPFTPGTEFLFPSSTSIFVDDDVLSTTIAGQSGNPASIWPAGPDGIFVWSGNIVRSQGAGSAGNPPPNAFSERRFFGGMELSPTGEGGSFSVNSGFIRDASRTIDGRGLGIRGESYTTPWSRTVKEFRTALTTNVSWERFYVRFRRVPTTDVGFWRCHGLPTDSVGFGLKWMTGGADVNGFGINLANSSEFDRGLVFSPNLDVWYRVDVLLKFDSGGGTSGIIKIYINGVLAFSDVDSGGTALNASANHGRSGLGIWNTITDNNVELDLDDWINADLPANVNADTLEFNDENYPLDWLLGSHVRTHYVRSGDITDWTGNIGNFNNGVSPSTNLGPALVSSTSGAIAEGLTDAPLQSSPDSIANVLGAVAAIVSAYQNNASSTDGSLGYKLAGAAAVDETIDQTSLNTFKQILYHPSGAILPAEISPFSIRHTKSADVAVDTTNGIMTVVEYIGIWGPEDDPTFEFPTSRLSNLHNCLYPNTAWGYLASKPASPVFAVGGTYTGNGLYQEITLPAPCHFLWIRPTSGGAGGVKYFGAGVGPHFGGDNRVIPNTRLFYDVLNDTTTFAVWGTSADVNQDTVEYQYIAFCDPGGRFSRCSAFSHATAAADTPIVNPIIDAEFLADAGFFQKNFIGTSSTIGLFYKGPGDAGSQASQIVGAALANFGTFGLGLFNSDSDSHFQGETSMSLWRTTEPGCAGVMVQILSYVGDGSSPRTIDLTPVSGRFPLFVIVIPTNTAAAFFKDPSHTDPNSSNADTLANSTTAITAVAIDQITVGATLNANGITYNVFCIPGDVAGMNNGIFFNPLCEAPDAAYVDPSEPEGDIIVMGEGGLVLSGDPATTLLVNVSGIYTLVRDKTDDTLQDTQPEQPSVDVAIPEPFIKTGFLG